MRHTHGSLTPHCGAQTDSSADIVAGWMLKHWARLVKQLSARGWELSNPRFAVLPHRAEWQIPDRLHED